MADTMCGPPSNFNIAFIRYRSLDLDIRPSRLPFDFCSLSLLREINNLTFDDRVAANYSSAGACVV